MISLNASPKLAPRPRAGCFPVLCLLAGLVTANAKADGVFSSLHSFGGNDGTGPARLVQGSDGNFYGTTVYGGYTNLNSGLGYGTVFTITTSGALASLYSFGGTNDGAYPYAGLVQGSDGNFYGTTESGGTNGNGGFLNGYGTVFKISAKGALTSLYSFAGAGDGAYPNVELVQGSDGDFYGSTSGGGGMASSAIFKIGTNGALNALFTFFPRSGSPSSLVQGGDGFFYGTIQNGGTSSDGAVFQISTNGPPNTLHSFSPGDGLFPMGGLVLGSDGNFYGTTQLGGNTNLNGGFGYGTVFTVTTNGALASLYSFGGTNDGANPYAGLVQGNNGYFYGTTSAGGGSGNGTVFAINTNGTGITFLYSFSALSGNKGYFDTGTNSDGANPRADLLLVGNTLYGTTSAGGSSGDGTVFSLSFAPQLTITPAGSNMILRWPISYAGFSYAGYAVQDTSDLLSPTNWSVPDPSPPIIVNGQFQITKPMMGPNRSYRLRSVQ